MIANEVSPQTIYSASDSWMYIYIASIIVRKSLFILCHATWWKTFHQQNSASLGKSLSGLFPMRVPMGVADFSPLGKSPHNSLGKSLQLPSLEKSLQLPSLGKSLISGNFPTATPIFGAAQLPPLGKSPHFNSHLWEGVFADSFPWEFPWELWTLSHLWERVRIFHLWDRIPLVVTFHLQLPSLGKILCDHLPTLHISEKMKKEVPIHYWWVIDGRRI